MPATHVVAATTNYTSAYSGGTINAGDTAVLNNGATVTGNVVDNGTLQDNQTDTLQLFANTGGRSGTFSAVNFTGLGAGQSATFNPATGFITVIPEPSTIASLLTGLAIGGSSVFRRRKRA